MHALLIAIPDRYMHVKEALMVLSNEELCAKLIMKIKRMFYDAAAGEVEWKEQKNVVLSTRKIDIRCFASEKNKKVHARMASYPVNMRIST